MVVPVGIPVGESIRRGAKMPSGPERVRFSGGAKIVAVHTPREPAPVTCVACVTAADLIRPLKTSRGLSSTSESSLSGMI